MPPRSSVWLWTLAAANIYNLATTVFRCCLLSREFEFAPQYAGLWVLDYLFDAICIMDLKRCIETARWATLSRKQQTIRVTDVAAAVPLPLVAGASVPGPVTPARGPAAARVEVPPLQLHVLPPAARAMRSQAECLRRGCCSECSLSFC